MGGCDSDSILQEVPNVGTKLDQVLVGSHFGGFNCGYPLRGLLAQFFQQAILLRFPTGTFSSPYTFVRSLGRDIAGKG
jgi:hypothetical protein